MKQQNFNRICTGIALAFLMLTATSSAEAVKIVNSVNSQVSTGEQRILAGQAGTDGVDGKDGKDGEKGEDGKNVFSGDTHASVFMQSVIDGVTVYDSNEVTTSDQHTEQFVNESGTTTIVDRQSATAHGTVQNEIIVGQSYSHYIQIQEILANIRLILESYVSKLF